MSDDWDEMCDKQKASARLAEMALVPLGLTAPAMVAKVREIVAANPERRYVKDAAPPHMSNCSYVRGDFGGNPGCIVGQALRALGVEEKYLGMLDAVGSVCHSPCDTDPEHQMTWARILNVKSNEDLECLKWL